jgi:hypothetical protein
VPNKSEHAQMLDSLKRPLPDWSGCVEGTKPLLCKRKHLLSVDCGKFHCVNIYVRHQFLFHTLWTISRCSCMRGKNENTSCSYRGG